MQYNTMEMKEKLLKRTLYILMLGVAAMTLWLQIFNAVESVSKTGTGIPFDLIKDIKEAGYNQMNKGAAPGKTVFVGDSLTEFCALETYYDGANYNRGISGDYTARLLARLDKNVIELQPKNVILLIGTNDLNRDLSVLEIVDNIVKIIDRLLSIKGVHIVVQSLYPVNAGLSSWVGARTNADIREINQLLQDLVETRYAIDNIVFVDVHSALIDADGNLKKDFSFDGLHLNHKGYLAASERIRPMFDPVY